MKAVGLVTRGRVTLGRGIVVIAGTEAYGYLRKLTDGLTDICGLYRHKLHSEAPKV